METLEYYHKKLSTFTGHAIDNLAIQNKPEFQDSIRYRDGVGREPTVITFTREGPIEVVTIPFYGKEVKLKFKFGFDRATVPQDVLDNFLAARDENVKKIGIMFDHVINEVWDEQKLKG